MSKWFSVLSFVVILALVQVLAPTDAWSIPQGACCYPDGTCANEQYQAQCEAEGGTYMGDLTICVQVECEPQAQGACCYPDGSCVDDQYQAQCETDGGTYMGDLTSCAQVQCGNEVRDETGGREKPSEFALFQNHPNPFNQATKIEFTLVKSGFVSLSIYDLLGRKVRTLASEHLPSGYKSVLWDGKNDSGEDVASGIYFYQLGVRDYSETKTLVLLK
ncbi:MAG: FlgD immunoglobulin-like domain containing protein [Candidatus Zixiibacteriota bacterium]